MIRYEWIKEKVDELNKNFPWLKITLIRLEGGVVIGLDGQDGCIVHPNKQAWDILCLFEKMQGLYSKYASDFFKSVQVD